MNYLEKYGYTPDEEKIAAGIKAIADNLDQLCSPEVLKQCFSIMDLTTLSTSDTVESVSKLVDKVNKLAEAYPDYPAPASICVYPNFAQTVRSRKNNPAVHVTTVSSCFPTAQSFLEVKVLECEMAVKGGADEIDIVLALNSFLAGDYDRAYEEIVTMKNAIDKAAAAEKREVVLKVILETGLLVTPANIAQASFLAMEAGADFIKTSTGKVSVNATPVAAYVMCEAIRRYYEVSGRKVGFKAAGGISTASDAICYYYIVSNILGRDWLCRERFRFGVSRLGNSLMSAIEQKTVNFF
ncbi:MAG: deoxyribose-phosphate aldolase [Bacteroidales bacterium]|jgi:deoxyribose-phosphate aldolase|nr:deoxyribose-phosphate aldolase [Bacteroidales bacterium]MBQ1857646.1 deoxyribose-phosphate aldolase [Bacteroidales bacterium]MBQ2107385.1 deoxyribose-phosphate aldolase [Bacteroidales bacterium]MBQ2229072.1 deoxyribose-phosphate aldolase [Bacteroidales bacterium]MBQ3942206.1 deoxyribose-phosphate aldolase [Bacteroidales bacterium]